MNVVSIPPLSIFTQVMEEGEKLSKKQLAQETTIKRLRAQVRRGTALLFSLIDVHALEALCAPEGHATL